LGRQKSGCQLGCRIDRTFWLENVLRLAPMRRKPRPHVAAGKSVRYWAETPALHGAKIGVGCEGFNRRAQAETPTVRLRAVGPT
jgi:hypothetical protein